MLYQNQMIQCNFQRCLLIFSRLWRKDLTVDTFDYSSKIHSFYLEIYVIDKVANDNTFQYWLIWISPVLLYTLNSRTSYTVNIKY